MKHTSTTIKDSMVDLMHGGTKQTWNKNQSCSFSPIMQRNKYSQAKHGNMTNLNKRTRMLFPSISNIAKKKIIW